MIVNKIKPTTLPIMNCELIDITTADTGSTVEIPLAQTAISAGFPSPADGLITLKLDLNRELIRNAAATFFARVSGCSMIDNGVDDGDLIVIDRSVEPSDGCMAVCYIDGSFTLKRFEHHGHYGLLIPANKNYEPIRVDANNDFSIWGIVRYIIKKV